MATSNHTCRTVWQPSSPLPPDFRDLSTDYNQARQAPCLPHSSSSRLAQTCGEEVGDIVWSTGILHRRGSGREKSWRMKELRKIFLQERESPKCSASEQTHESLKVDRTSISHLKAFGEIDGGGSGDDHRHSDKRALCDEDPDEYLIPD